MDDSRSCMYAALRAGNIKLPRNTSSLLCLKSICKDTDSDNMFSVSPYFKYNTMNLHTNPLR